MAYPESIDRFVEKLNKKQDGSVYVIEEELQMIDGKYEGFLSHDNIATNSIRVYTGPKLTGVEIKDVIISIPQDMPWRRKIKIFSDANPVYVTYQTPGDTVEADDINVLQESIIATQTELERYKEKGIVDGGTFERSE